VTDHLEAAKELLSLIDNLHGDELDQAPDLERSASAHALVDIAESFRCMNEGRDSFHREVLEVLTQAKEPARCEDTFQHREVGAVKCSLQPGHYGEHRGGAEGRRFLWPSEGPSGAGATAGGGDVD
jgi:hypothetical protein